MCGIAGIFAYRDSAPAVDRDELLRIREHMIRRGPDGAGLWLTEDGRLGLAHRRLAIIELTDAGAQPMASGCGRYVVTFNGEIYNHNELRCELEAGGAVFRSHSDTEVLLHLYALRGERMVEALRGMFAFALWDNIERTLFLARDPFGIKPLYLSDDGRTLRLASQVKALLAGGAIGTAPEPAGSVGFFILGSVPEPYTIYRHIRALPAGSTMMVRHGRVEAARVYFDPRQTLLRAQEAGAGRSPVATELAEAVRNSVSAHLLADVPIGIFLSAGIDSGALAGMAAEVAAARLRSVTLGFHEYRNTENDEVPIARQVAEHYGIAHHAEWITREDFDGELDSILATMDQPSIDGVNTYLVSRAAAHGGMKVALSGLGGDELFGGYPSFKQVPRLARALAWTRHFRRTGVLVRKTVQRCTSPGLSPKFAGLMEYGGTTGGGFLLRRSLFMPWELDALMDPRIVRAGMERLGLVARLEATHAGLHSPHARIAALELNWYMRNQLLRDADWAGMAHSLEIRVPLVDAQLFEAMAPTMVFGTHLGKKDLASYARKPLPAAVVQRAKSGFTTPVSQWIGAEAGPRTRGLRKWARQIHPQPPKAFRALALVTDAYGGVGGIAKFNRDLLGSVVAMPGCAEVVCLPRVISRPVVGVPERVRFVVGAAAGKGRFIRALAQALREGPYDLLIIGHINLAGLGVWVAKWLGVPTQLFVHGIDCWKPHLSRSVRDSLKHIDQVVSVSQLTLDRLNMWARLEPTRQRILPNCVDLDAFTPGPRDTQLATSLGLAGKTVLMTFGRLADEERYKGFDEIIELMPSLGEEVPNLMYVICGEGPDRARLEDKCQMLGVAHQVVFTGFVAEEHKADHYRLADAYVMPSRGEGFGIVFLEAMACGVPVMGSRLDGGREALLDGRLGELVDPTSADDIRAGVIRTLTRAHGRSNGIETYTSESFRRRAHVLLDELRGGVLRSTESDGTTRMESATVG